MNDQMMNNEFSIAIIGMGGRFPGADNLEKFWQNLCNAVECVAGVNDDIMLDDVDKFDADFFGYSANEAKLTDPQQRILLEIAWKTFEDAGYNPYKCRQKIGVFCGTAFNEYFNDNLAEFFAKNQSSSMLAMMLHGNNNDYSAPRISYKLNLKGPSMVIQTACSTSLVAVHVACQNLLAYQCDMALAGGASLVLSHDQTLIYELGGILSPDKRCRAFDDKANGTVFGSGVGLVLLKRYEDAIKDRDHIYAVIKGSAVNNDGAQKAGFSAPSMDGQKEVISDALKMAAVAPNTISYIETHGTGTSLGDYIEFSALNDIFNQYKNQHECVLGAVKTNIGHLLAAAGIAGLIKTVLCLQHKKIPPTVNFDIPNPRINFDDSAFCINTAARDWKSDELLRAGVSSFGIGGTNAHVVLEEAPSIISERSNRSHQLLIFSAKTHESLTRTMKNIQKFFTENKKNLLEDIAYTLQAGRQHMQYRSYVVAADHQDAAVKLDLKHNSTLQLISSPLVTMMFSSQERQNFDMIRILYQQEPVFKKHIDFCVDFLRNNFVFDLSEFLFENKNSDDNQSIFSQLALFVVEYSLAKLFISFGVEPDFVIGYGLGEYAAACVAGVFKLENALEILLQRSQLIKSASIAVDNNSHAMQKITHKFEDFLKKFNLSAPTKKIISSVTGNLITNEEITSYKYWAEHLCDAAQFNSNLEPLSKTTENHILIEIGLSDESSDFIKLIKDQQKILAVLNAIPKLRQKHTSEDFFLNTIGVLWSYGIDINWDCYQGNEKRHRVSLPGYSFEKKRYWVDVERNKSVEVKNSEIAELDSAKDDNSITDGIMDIFNDVLGGEEIAPDDDFFELGGHSLLGTQIVSRLSSQYHVDISLEDLNEYNTINKIADFLEQKLIEKVTNMSEEEAAAYIGEL